MCAGWFFFSAGFSQQAYPPILLRPAAEPSNAPFPLSMSFFFLHEEKKKKKKKTTTKLPDGLADTHHRYYYRCRRDSTTVSYGDGSEDSQIYQPPEQRSAVFTNILR